MPSFFISYSSKDTEFARGLASLLRTYGDSVFLAHDSIEAGANGWSIMLDNMRAADWVILAATPNACESGGVRREMEEASRMGKLIIPLLKDVTVEELQEKLGDVMSVGQAVPVDDPVKWKAFLDQFGKKVGNGNLLAGAILGFVAGLLVAAFFVTRGRKN